MHHQDDEDYPVKQSSDMRIALREAGNPADWEPLGTANDNGYFTPQTRAAGYARMISFLDKTIGKQSMASAK